MLGTPLHLSDVAPCRLRPTVVRRRWRPRAWIWLGLALSGVFGVGARAGEVTTEYDVKAALLFHFTQFVEWPPSTFATPDAPLVIGVLGANPFGDVLENLVEPKQESGHRIEVMLCRDVTQAERCHLLFISSSERANLPQIVEALHHRPILTVADFDGFLRHGGMVQFRKTAQGKIRLRVGLEKAKAAGLTLSSKLLRVVEIVPPEEE